MEPVELKAWELTPQRQDRFDSWIGGLSHHGFVDVRNKDIHFTSLTKPLAQSTLALVSTGGLRMKSQPPYDLLDHDGDWSIRAIDSDVSASDLTIDHSHYNHGDADEDINCMFPIERIRELAATGFVGSVAKTSVGMMGFVPNGAHVVEEAGPEAARRLKAAGTDVALLTGG